MQSEKNTVQPPNFCGYNSLSNIGIGVVIADIRTVFRILYGSDTMLGTDDFLQNAIRVTIRVLDGWKEASTQRNTGLIVPSIQNGRIMEQVYTWATGLIIGNGCSTLSPLESQKWSLIVQTVAQRLGYCA